MQNLIANNLQLSKLIQEQHSLAVPIRFIDQARIALNLTDEQVDEMWQEAQNN